MRYTDDDQEFPELPAHRRLRLMVMALMVCLILGILAISATVVIRLGFGVGGTSADPVAAPSFTLPEGEIVTVGRGEGTVMFVVRDADGTERLHVFDAAQGGAALSTSEIGRE